MIASPEQLLIQFLLGLVALLAVLAGAVLLYRSTVRKVVPAPRPTQPDRVTAHPEVVALSERADDADRRRRVWQAVAGILLLLLAGAGHWLLEPFWPHADAGRADLRSNSRLVAGAGGAQLSVNESGPPDGPTLVFTHGWGADRQDWSWLVQSLPPTYHVVTWDLPGLGVSSQGDSTGITVPGMADDLDRVVDSLGGRKVTLIGHSVGGMIDLEFARRHPQRLASQVTGIVQVDTTYTNPLATKKGAERSLMLQKPVLEPLLHAMIATSPLCRAMGWLAYQSGLAHLQLAAQSFAGRETWRQLDEMASYSYRSAPDVVARGVLSMAHWDATPVLPAITVPTLVISGVQDTTTLPAASDRMAHDIPHAQRASIDPAAHLGPVEQAQRYGALVDAFARSEASAK